MAHVPRVYVQAPLGPGPLSLGGEAARRLGTVGRVSPGEALLLFAGDGREWSATVTGASKGAVSVSVGEVVRQASTLPVVLETWIGTIRANRFETALEKCVEAGADIVRPMACEFSQRGDAPSSARAERWQRIVVEASEQSGRLFLPVVQPVGTFERTLRSHHGALVVAARDGMRAAELAKLLPESGHLALIVGPEGGLSPGEEAAARAAGALPLSLGPYILRTETAAIAGTSLLRALTF